MGSRGAVIISSNFRGDVVKASKESDSCHTLCDDAVTAEVLIDQAIALLEKANANVVHVHLALEPHVGTAIVARAEAEAAHIAEGRKKEGEQRQSPSSAASPTPTPPLLSGAGKGPARRPELVVLVSHEVAKRGRKEVRQG